MYPENINIHLDYDLQPTINIPQFDSGRELNIYLDSYIIPDKSETRIYIKKPSGHEIYYLCNYIGNKIICRGTLQMFAEIGQNLTQIQIISDGTYLGSFPFIFNVVNNPVAHIEIESKDEYAILDDLIDEARAIIITEASRVDAENSRVQAENQRVTEFNEIKANLENIGNTVTAQGNTAEQKGNIASQQGNVSEQQGNVASQQGTVAETKGNNAQVAADRANTAAQKAENIVDNLDTTVRDIVINDSTSSELTTYSSQKIETIAQDFNTISGSSIYANGSEEAPIVSLRLCGRADQGSTTGKNLFDADSWEILDRQSDGSYKTNQATTANNLQFDIPVGVYTLSYDCKCDANSNARLRVNYEDGTTGATIIASNGTFIHFKYVTEDKKISSICTDFSRYGSGIEFKDIQLESGSVETSYEPYTGGAPSPSPEYPQEIDIAGLGHTTGAQLWDAGNVSGTQSTKVDVSVPIPPGTYTLSADVISSDTDADACLIFDYTNNIAIGNIARGQGKSKTFTTDKEIRSFVFYASVSNNGSAGDTFSLRNIMLNAGSSALPWEPYTGGKPGYYEKGIEVDYTGKNLFSLDSDIVFTKEICDITKKTNEITLTSTGSSDTVFCQYACYLSEEVTKYFCGKTITVSAKHKTNNSSLSPVVFINLYNSDNEVIAGEKSIYFYRGSSVTVIVPKETARIRFIFRVDQLRGQVVGDFVRMYDIQAEEGSTATSYEPYRTPQSVHISTPNGLAGLKVSSGGNYTDESGQQWICDEIVRDERGTGKRIQRVAKKVLDGSEGWSKTSDTGADGSNCYILSFPSGHGEKYITHFRHGAAYVNQSYCGEYIAQNDILFLLSNCNTVDEFKSWLTEQYNAGKPVTVLYVLETPVETVLSAEEIISLSSFHTYPPITSVTNNAECEMEIIYAKTQTGKYVSQNLKHKQMVECGVVQFGNALMEYDYQKKAIKISFSP